MKTFTAVRYFLVLTVTGEEKEIVSILSPIGLLPKKMVITEGQSGHERQKQISEAMFRIIGTAFTCLENIESPHNEDEMLIIGRLETFDDEQSIKFLKLFDERRERNKESFLILSAQEIKNFKKTHANVLKEEVLDEV